MWGGEMIRVKVGAFLFILLALGRLGSVEAYIPPKDAAANSEESKKADGSLKDSVAEPEELKKADQALGGLFDARAELAGIVAVIGIPGLAQRVAIIPSLDAYTTEVSIERDEKWTFRYNPNFVRSLIEKTGTKWSATFL